MTTQPFSAGTDNYTAAELNAILTLSTPDYMGFFLHIYTGLMLFYGGLYYPRVDLSFGFPPGLTCGFRINNNPFLGGPYVEWGNSGTAGALTIELLSGTISIPIYLMAFYQDVDMGYIYPSNAVTNTCNVTITPVKYWPYKDAADVALYDEDTGAKV